MRRGATRRRMRALLVAEHSRLFAENHFNRFARAWPVGAWAV